MIALAALTLYYWRAVVQPPVFRPEQIAMAARAEALYQSKVNQGRDAREVK